MIKSICLVRLSALGDVLMLVPLVRTLQAELLGVTITWIISRPAFDLVEGMNGVEFIVIDKPTHIMDYWRFKRQLQGRQFDVLLAVQASFRANLLYACISASRKIGYDPLRAKDGHAWFINEAITAGHDHTVDGFLRFADALGIQNKHIRWELPIEGSDVSWARSLIQTTHRPLILINPAASKPERSWLIDRYIAVIQHVQSRWQAQVLLIGGPGAFDKALGEAITQYLPDVLSVIGQTRPKQLLALIQQADLLLCPDTGPSHMAAAVGTPVIALHAVTSSTVSGPYTYQQLSVDCYPEAVRSILKKTTDTIPWGTHVHGDKTMELVSVNAVIARLDEVLDHIT